MKYYIGFNLTVGTLWILTKTDDLVWNDLPKNLTREVIDQYDFDIDLIVEQYVTMVNKNYGGIHEFEAFQPNYKDFLKHLRSL